MENQEALTKEHFTTGEVAALCSVTPDTVLKWIRAGKIQAARTPGGHHRIPRSTLHAIINGTNHLIERNIETDSFEFCWEFKSVSGQIEEGCRKCIVYRSRTKRCYEMSELPQKAGHIRLFCEGSCESCDYFRMVQGQKANVLVVTDKEDIKNSLEIDTAKRNFNMQITDCEYRCSMLVEKFRPDYVVIDCTMGVMRSREFAKLLYEDPRIPFVKVALVGDRGNHFVECDEMVFAYIERPITSNTITNLIEGSKLR